ncbi:MAG: N-acetylmuramoyl-L-alanine amidase [Phycisphaerales bacterium]|nr:MAG: N-acetylmuramoyl-L-alanine amidase [Phycisphaerales bacterium]
MRKATGGVALLLCVSGCATTGRTDPPPVNPRLYTQRPLPPPTYPRPPYDASGIAANRPPAPHRPPPSAYGAAAWWYPPGGISGRWREIIIHHSATTRGGAAAFDRYHREANGWDELGYHFVIGNGTETADGAIEVGSRWTSQKHGAHCKTPDNYFNDHGIGICLVGNFQNGAPSAAQLASLNRLVAFLMRTTGIDRNHIRTHAEVTGKTACPGRYFSVSALKASVGYRAADYGTH